MPIQGHCLLVFLSSHLKLEVVHDQGQCIFHSHFCECFANADAFTPRKRDKSKGASQTAIRLFGYRICGVKPLRNILGRLLPLRRVVMHAMDIEHNRVTRTDPHPTNIHILREAPRGGGGCRRVDPK